MNVLEKILEEIRDNAKLGNMHLESIRIEKVEEIIRSHMNEKEKVTSAEIISRKTDGKPYYEIKYKKVGEDHYTVGYSSYYLDYVIGWLNNYFEFCGEPKIVVGVGKDTNVLSNDGWIPVEERLPEEHNSMFAKYYGTSQWSNVMWKQRSDKVNVIYELEDGTRKVTTSYTLDGIWKLEKEYRILKKKVVAWQPLPEPYKPEEKARKHKNAQQVIEDLWNNK